MAQLEKGQTGHFVVGVSKREIAPMGENSTQRTKVDIPQGTPVKFIRWLDEENQNELGRYSELGLYQFVSDPEQPKTDVSTDVQNFMIDYADWTFAMSEATRRVCIHMNPSKK